MKKSIVTGGSGFIGSHIVDELIKLGHEVIVIDDESAEANECFYCNSKAKYYKLSINDYEKFFHLFAGVNYVFHLAAESRIQPTLERPVIACQTNFIGTCNVLEASRQYGDNARVIYSSTSSGYGLKNEPPLDESMERDCLNPYSVSKVAAEDLCKMYYTLYKLETITLRYFNVYGERQPEKGHYAPVVGLFMKQNSEGKPMTVVGDGLQTRDYTYIDDVVEANILAAATDKGLGLVHNIGTGTSNSILDIVEMIGGDHIHVPSRPGESRHTRANNSRAKQNLGWIPKMNLKKWIQTKALKTV